jgi:hypothetical protein
LDTTMAYVKTRTRGGSVSTALVEAYRDPQGRPRQRVLANLHGEPDLVSALAKLAVLRADLQEEKGPLAAEVVKADEEIYENGTRYSVDEVEYTAAERKEIGMGMRQGMLARLAEIDVDLATIQKDGVVIKKHCTGTPEQIQSAIKAYKLKLRDAEALAMGMEFSLGSRLAGTKAKLRRLQSV